ncbi:hypothetical protein C1645_818893 [Glomus cerebriforme]|uniref:Uncharacterized protein n=1 Tax=Glomus cerebriforme TaxID=658196 RepID=A0A397TBZ2_9GLOM|nr:hypothetical protein C1645_818893 [Glomus cerebriforme]
MLYEELPSHNDPISQTSQSAIRSSKNYTFKLCITAIILIIWSAAQGITSFHIGSIFNSSSLIAFGISSFSQIIIILYIYHKLLTEHYKLTLIHIGDYFDSRKKTEKLIAIFGIIIFIILAIITIFIAFYANKQEKDNPKKPLPPGTIPPFYVNSTIPFYTNNHFVSGPPWQLLVFGIYVIHPYVFLILSTWYIFISKQSEVWNEATVWVGLFLPTAYIIFISSQLSSHNNSREVIFTLIISVMFLVYATKLGWMYLWNEIGNVECVISHSSEIEDLEEE